METPSTATAPATATAPTTEDWWICPEDLKGAPAREKMQSLSGTAKKFLPSNPSLLAEFCKLVPIKSFLDGQNCKKLKTNQDVTVKSKTYNPGDEKKYIEEYEIPYISSKKKPWFFANSILCTEKGKTFSEKVTVKVDEQHINDVYLTNVLEHDSSVGIQEVLQNSKTIRSIIFTTELYKDYQKKYREAGESTKLETHGKAILQHIFSCGYWFHWAKWEELGKIATELAATMPDLKEKIEENSTAYERFLQSLEANRGVREDDRDRERTVEDADQEGRSRQDRSREDGERNRTVQEGNPEFARRNRQRRYSYGDVPHQQHHHQQQQMYHQGQQYYGGGLHQQYQYQQQQHYYGGGLHQQHQYQQQHPFQEQRQYPPQPFQHRRQPPSQRKRDINDVENPNVSREVPEDDPDPLQAVGRTQNPSPSTSTGSDNAQRARKLEDYVQRVTELEERLKAADEEKVAHKAQIDELQRGKVEADAAIKELRTGTTESAATIERLETENSTLASDTKIMTDAIDQLKTDKSKLETKLEEKQQALVTQNAKSESDTKIMTDTIDQLKTDKTKLETKLEEKQHALDNQKAKSESDTRDMTNTIEQLMMSKSRLETKLETELEMKVKGTESYRELKKKNEKEVADREAQLVEQNAILEQQNVELVKWEAELEHKNTLVADMEDHMEQQEAQLEQQRVQLAIWEAELEQENTLVADQEAQLANKETTIQELNNDKTYLGNVEARLEFRINNLKGTLAHSQDMLESRTSDLRESERLERQVRDALADLQTELNNFKRESEQTKNSLELTIETSETTKQQLQETITNLNKSQDRNTRTLEERNEEIRGLIQEKHDLHTAKRELEHNLRTQQEQHGNIQKASKESLEALQKQLEGSQASNIELEQKLRTQQEQHGNIQEASKESLEALQKQLDESQASVADLQRKLKKSEGKVAEAKKELETVLSKLMDKDHDLIRLEEEKRGVEREGQQNKEMKEAAQNELTDLRRQLMRLQEEKRGVEREGQQNKEMKEAAQNELTKLRHQLVRLQVEKKGVEREFDDHKRSVSDYEIIKLDKNALERKLTAVEHAKEQSELQSDAQLIKLRAACDIKVYKLQLELLELQKAQLSQAGSGGESATTTTTTAAAKRTIDYDKIYGGESAFDLNALPEAGPGTKLAIIEACCKIYGHKDGSVWIGRVKKFDRKTRAYSLYCQCYTPGMEQGGTEIYYWNRVNAEGSPPLKDLIDPDDLAFVCDPDGTDTKDEESTLRSQDLSQQEDDFEVVTALKVGVGKFPMAIRRFAVAFLVGHSNRKDKKKMEKALELIQTAMLICWDKRLFQAKNMETIERHKDKVSKLVNEMRTAYQFFTKSLRYHQDDKSFSGEDRNWMKWALGEVERWGECRCHYGASSFKMEVILQYVYQELLEIDEKRKSGSIFQNGDGSERRGFNKIRHIVEELEDPRVSYAQFLTYINMFDKKEHPIVQVLLEDGRVVPATTLLQRLDSWEAHPESWWGLHLCGNGFSTLGCDEYRHVRNGTPGLNMQHLRIHNEVASKTKGDPTDEVDFQSKMDAGVGKDYLTIVIGAFRDFALRYILWR